MNGDWDGHDFRDMAAGVLGFTLAQASVIRARVLASRVGTTSGEPRDYWLNAER
jgi:hypothetical protein